MVKKKGNAVTCGLRGEVGGLLVFRQVDIREKDTNNNVVSGIDGKYSIKATSGSTLEFMLIGNEIKEVITLTNRL